LTDAVPHPAKGWEQRVEDQMPPEDNQLRFIERFEHRGYQIKIARRGDDIKLLIYPPEATLATQMVTEAIADYEEAVHSAKRLVDSMIKAAQESDRFLMGLGPLDPDLGPLDPDEE
jgi:hypothetical protein